MKSGNPHPPVGLLKLDPKRGCRAGSCEVPGAKKERSPGLFERLTLLSAGRAIAALATGGRTLRLSK